MGNKNWNQTLKSITNKIGYEIKPHDVGNILPGFDRVIQSDVGRMIYKYDYGFVMESMEQMKSRENNETTT